MTPINSIEELKQLAIGEKFYVISEGNIRSYLLTALHPKIENIVVTIWDADYTTAKIFSKTSFNANNVFLQGSYNLAIVGNIMIAQLERRAESIRRIYIYHSINN